MSDLLFVCAQLHNMQHEIHKIPTNMQHIFHIENAFFLGKITENIVIVKSIIIKERIT